MLAVTVTLGTKVSFRVNRSTTEHADGPSGRNNARRVPSKRPHLILGRPKPHHIHCRRFLFLRQFVVVHLGQHRVDVRGQFREAYRILSTWQDGNDRRAAVKMFARWCVRPSDWNQAPIARARRASS